ncbi:short-chain dehydrogenase/reductase [Xylariaceae sp. FL1019]|nr:short-chain dehydrogenase/reductase [Xylariaceae sp. FL1019]
MASTRKSVLITGCSPPGIGYALAEAFRKKNYHVFATLRDPSKLPSAFASAPNVTVLTLDVLSSVSIANAVEAVRKETGGKLDILVNNSGAVVKQPGLDHPIDEAKEMFDLNFFAPMAMLQAFAEMIVSARGCVVNNASVTAIIPITLTSVYNASKAALMSASETWRLELQPLGVRVITIMTGGVKTGIGNKIPQVKLPSTSYYHGVQDYINGKNSGGAPSLEDPSQYATSVLRTIETGANGLIWAGSGAGSARWIKFVPQGLVDSLLEKRSPLSEEMSKATGKKRV